LEGHYYNFTDEKESDLLAELDVWNELQKMQYIEFDKLGINKKAYYRIREHIGRMQDAVKEIVTITSSGARQSIKKACLAGMVSYVYRYTGMGYENGDRIERKLEKKSCLKGWNCPELLVGKPRIIEYKDSWDQSQTMDLVTMATKVTTKELEEIAPQFINEEENDVYYSSYEDVVKVKTIIYFKDIRIGERTIEVPNHPDYERLKSEYERNRRTYYEDRRQKTVKIDGEEFEIEYSWGEASITVDTYTLYHSDAKRITLDDGTNVTLAYYGNSWHAQKGNTMSDLRNKVERARVKSAWDTAKKKLPKLESFEISSVLKCIPYIGKKEITIGNGGYGEPIYGFGCLMLQKKNSLTLELIEEEEKAVEKTKEAIEFLYGKYINENYSEKKFKFRKGIKGLSPKEQKVKEEFNSEVRELQNGLEIGNIEERLAYLQELYDVLVEDLKVA